MTDAFADTVKTELGLDAEAPYSGGTYDLVSLKCLEAGNKKHIERAERGEQRPKKRASLVFERLVDAGRRLMVVIEHNRGGANKDLAKFADQINALSDKWDR